MSARLNSIEQQSSAWIVVTDYIEEKIAHLHKQNEKTSKTIEETMVIRGEIKALRLLKKEMEQGTSAVTD